jgi:hypothetical protein
MFLALRFALPGSFGEQQISNQNNVKINQE